MALILVEGLQKPQKLSPLVLNDVINTVLSNGMTVYDIGTWQKDLLYHFTAIFGWFYCMGYGILGTSYFEADYKECYAGWVFYYYYQIWSQ
jgi:hypothetical protein